MYNPKWNVTWFGAFYVLLVTHFSTYNLYSHLKGCHVTDSALVAMIGEHVMPLRCHSIWMRIITSHKASICIRKLELPFHTIIRAPSKPVYYMVACMIIHHDTSCYIGPRPNRSRLSCMDNFSANGATVCWFVFHAVGIPLSNVLKYHIVVVIREYKITMKNLNDKNYSRELLSCNNI